MTDTVLGSSTGTPGAGTAPTDDTAAPAPRAAGDDAAEQARREQAVVDEVLAAYAATPDARTREVLQAVVRHLHALVREVRLTDAEWAAAIAFLTDTGQMSTGTRQEFILLSDVLGVSMQTVAVNSPARGAATESTVFGPFFVDDAPRVERGGDVAQGAKGRPCHVAGTVRGVGGEAVAGARIEVWEADADGFYDVQYDGGPTQGRGHLSSADDGSYDFWCVTPSAYPIPTDGPVGRLMRAAARHPYRPAHLHFMVTAPGYRTLVTHIFVPGSDYLDSDAVFGVKPSLVVAFDEHPPGTAPGGRILDTPWTSARFDIVLAPHVTTASTGGEQP